MTHPYSPLQLSKPETFPAVPLLEERARTWVSASDEYLVGFVMESWGTDTANQTPAVMEMQRRLMCEIKKFNKSSTRLAVVVILIAGFQLVVAGLQVWIAYHQTTLR